MAGLPPRPLLRFARAEPAGYTHVAEIEPLLYHQSEFGGFSAALPLWEDAAVIAAEGRAKRGVQHLGIVRRDAEVASVGQRRESCDTSDRVGETGAVAPLHWPLEALNGLIMAVRHKRCRPPRSTDLFVPPARPLVCDYWEPNRDTDAAARENPA
jgi:hypothetical protein